MLRTIFRLCITVLSFTNIETRVYCGDPLANKLTFVGFSCPLKCANVIAVVEQLKIVDYHRLLEEDRDRLKSSGFDLRFSKLRQQNETEKSKIYSRRLFNEYSRVLTRKAVLYYLNKELKHYVYLDKLNKDYCHAAKNITKLLDVLPIKQCTRRSPYENDFARRVTKILNKYAHKQFPFSKSLVVRFLRQILGTSGTSRLDLREGDIAVHKLLTYLRHAINEANQDVTIVHMSPRHCLNKFVPGCYCKKGYLERTGQCITLETCLHEGNKDLTSYLHRVVIH